MPALLMRTSIGPWVKASSMTRSATRVVEIADDRDYVELLDSGGDRRLLRAVPMIVAPCAWSVRAISRPMLGRTGDQNTSS